MKGHWAFNPWHGGTKKSHAHGEYIFRVFAVLPFANGNSSRVIAEKFTQSFFLQPLDSSVTCH